MIVFVVQNARESFTTKTVHRRMQFARVAGLRSRQKQVTVAHSIAENVRLNTRQSIQNKTTKYAMHT
jgi:hypothetical protein